MERLERLLPEEIQRLLRRIGELAEEKELSAYLAGGLVRDLFLNRPNLDVDVVVEGEGIKFAQAIAGEFRGKVKAHRRFQTAVVTFPNGFYIDVATARSEIYKHPAALPEVKPSSIQQDLSRRDFSINAMVIALNTPTFGQLIDLFDGQRDVERKQIKILHDLSFVEDPTRIFRAVCFEQRYGFRLESRTEKMLCKAVKAGLIERLTKVRIRNELIQILSEDTAYLALRRLEELGVLKSVYPRLKIRRNLESLFKRLEEAAQRLETYFPRSTQRWPLFLSALLSGFSLGEVLGFCEQMRFKKKDTKIVMESIAASRLILEPLSSKTNPKNSRLYELLHGLSQEALVYLSARNTKKAVRERIIFYLENLRKVRISLTGADLVRLGFKPSPYFGQVLKSLLEAKLDGRIHSRQDEIKLAKKNLERLEGNR